MLCSFTDRICPSHKFLCANDKCILPSEICDGKDDCGDNSDETTGCAKGRLKVIILLSVIFTSSMPVKLSGIFGPMSHNFYVFTL